MKNTVIESSKSNGKVNSTPLNAKADKSKTEQQRVNGLPISLDFNDKAKYKTESK